MVISTCSVTLHGISPSNLPADFLHAFSNFTSFSLLQRETLPSVYFECGSSYFPIAERGSAHSIPTHPLHTSHGFQDTLKYFFFQINHLSSISSHRNHLLPFIILAAPLQTFFNLILPSGRNQNCAPMVD